MKKQVYFLELNETEVRFLRRVCSIGYQVARENYSFQMMMKSRDIGKKLDTIIKELGDG